MACNCKSVGEPCNKCECCVPIGVTNLTTCSPIDPCDGDTIDLCCINPHDIECLSLQPGANLCEVIAEMLDQLINVNQCTCECHVYTITNTSGSTWTRNYFACNNGTNSLATISVPDNTSVQVCGCSNIKPLQSVPGVLIEDSTDVCGAAQICECHIYEITNNTNTDWTRAYTGCNNGGNFNNSVTVPAGETVVVCGCSDIIPVIAVSGITIVDTTDVCTSPLCDFTADFSFPTTTTTSTTSTTSTTTTTTVAPCYFSGNFTYNPNNTVTIQLTITGSTVTGPFNLHCVDGSDNTIYPAFQTGITLAQLQAGFTSNTIPVGCTKIRLKEVGTSCFGTLDFILPTTTSTTSTTTTLAPGCDFTFVITFPTTTTSTSTTSTSTTTTTTINPCSCITFTNQDNLNSQYVSWDVCPGVAAFGSYQMPPNSTFKACGKNPTTDAYPPGTVTWVIDGPCDTTNAYPTCAVPKCYTLETTSQDAFSNCIITFYDMYGEFQTIYTTELYELNYICAQEGSINVQCNGSSITTVLGGVTVCTYTDDCIPTTTTTTAPPIVCLCHTVDIPSFETVWYPTYTITYLDCDGFSHTITSSIKAQLTGPFTFCARENSIEYSIPENPTAYFVVTTGSSCADDSTCSDCQCIKITSIDDTFEAPYAYTDCNGLYVDGLLGAQETINVCGYYHTVVPYNNMTYTPSVSGNCQLIAPSEYACPVDTQACHCIIFHNHNYSNNLPLSYSYINCDNVLIEDNIAVGEVIKVCGSFPDAESLTDVLILEDTTKPCVSILGDYLCDLTFEVSCVCYTLYLESGNFAVYSYLDCTTQNYTTVTVSTTTPSATFCAVPGSVYIVFDSSDGTGVLLTNNDPCTLDTDCTEIQLAPQRCTAYNPATSSPLPPGTAPSMEVDYDVTYTFTLFDCTLNGTQYASLQNIALNSEDLIYATGFNGGSYITNISNWLTGIATGTGFAFYDDMKVIDTPDQLATYSIHIQKTWGSGIQDYFYTSIGGFAIAFPDYIDYTYTCENAP